MGTVRRLRACVLSAGAWSLDSHLPALAADPRVHLIAASSPRPDVRKAIGQTYDITTLEDWRQCLDLAPDIVVVSSPPVAHVEQVVAAFEAGAHVLVEKPFALSSADAATMTAAARRHGRAIVVGYGWPASPIFARARTLVDQDTIGPIEFLHCHLSVPIRNILEGGGDGGWGARLASESATYADPAISAGGARAVAMSHQLGMVTWLAGQRFAEISATLWPNHGLDRHVAANGSLTDGTVVSLACSASHPVDTRPSWRVTLVGGNGQLEIDNHAGRLSVHGRDGAPILIDDAVPSEYVAGSPTTAVIDAAAGAEVPLGLRGDLAEHVVAVTEAIATSHTTGTTIRIAPAAPE